MDLFPESPEIEATQQTYARIAAAYVQAWRQRDALRPHLDRFAALVAPGGVVADIGCGPGFDGQYLAGRGLRLVGLDYSLEMMAAGRAGLGINIDFVQADMRALPLAPLLDGIWCCAALLHLPRPAVPATLRQFRRLVRPQAVMYLSVKQGRGDAWVPNPYAADLTRFYSFWQPAPLDAVLQAAGWVISEGWAESGEHADWLVRLVRPDPGSGAK